MAFSLANFSNELFSSLALEKARRQYTVALGMTNNALGSPPKITQDTTLITVIMLAMFEKMTKRDRHSIEAEKKHIDGAIVLAKLRGPEQFKSPITRRIFSQLNSLVVANYNERGIKVPADFQELQMQASRYIDTTEI
jgi:hypothetical protein